MHGTLAEASDASPTFSKALADQLVASGVSLPDCAAPMALDQELGIVDTSAHVRHMWGSTGPVLLAKEPSCGWPMVLRMPSEQGGAGLGVWVGPRQLEQHRARPWLRKPTAMTCRDVP